MTIKPERFKELEEAASFFGCSDLSRFTTEELKEVLAIKERQLKELKAPKTPN